MKRQLIVINCIILFLVFSFVMAQDGSIPIETPMKTPEPTPDATPGPTPTPTPDTTPVPTPMPPPAGGSGAGTARTNPPQPTLTPRGTPLVTPTPQPAFLTETPEVLPVSAPESSDGPSPWVWIIIASSAALGLMTAFFKGKLKEKSQQSDEDRCGGIKELLEQKKKELEEYLKSLPADKAESFIKSKIIKQVKKNEDIKEVLEVYEGAKEGYDEVKAKYEQLQKAIELLEKKFNLCMLELPSGEKPEYKGTIIESSLKDREILKSLKIEKNYPLEDWILNDVLVSEKQIQKLGQYMNDGPWYMHFWKEGSDEVHVVYKDKIFKIKYSDKSSWKDALEHGKARGIPEEQLDFSIKE